MKIRVGINGFGRIGRQVMRAIRQYYPNDIDVVAFNDLGDLPTMAHLYRHDSNYGAYPGKVEVKQSALVIDGDEIKAFAEKEPNKIPWGNLGVQIVLESTGRFTDAEKAKAHLDGGAKKVVISAPAKGEDLTLVLGVNDHMYDPARHNIISNASCTTNCLAPVAKVVNDVFGIDRALVSTVHSYTNDQQILDLPHKDLRRARAAALSIIPTSTGAAKAVSLVIPELKGKFDGIAMRVPTPTVSVIDFTADVQKAATKDSLVAAFKEAANGKMKGILAVSEEPLVSVDYKGNAHSSIVDAEFTQVIGEKMVKVLAWYDNEWGYSVRCADLMVMMGKKL
jgi:glyceraldehyde 3-phosphate dehydrogenase